MLGAYLCCALECEATGYLLLLSHNCVGLRGRGIVHSQGWAGRQGGHQTCKGSCWELLDQLLGQLLALYSGKRRIKQRNQCGGSYVAQ